MKSILQRRNVLLILFVLICALAALAIYLYRVSSVRKIQAESVVESDGYAIVLLPDESGRIFPGDKAPAQAFELVRPSGSPVTIGRMITSCPCIVLEAPKMTFAAGERAVLTLRNVKETQGQMYSLYVQVTEPKRATLRRDVFVQSDHFLLHKSAGDKQESDSGKGEGRGIRQRSSLTTLLDQLSVDASNSEQGEKDSEEDNLSPKSEVKQ